MEGTLRIVSCGVNFVHGNKVFSDATTEWNVQGCWFDDETELAKYVEELRLEDEGFMSAIFTDELGVEIEF